MRAASKYSQNSLKEPYVDLYPPLKAPLKGARYFTKSPEWDLEPHLEPPSFALSTRPEVPNTPEVARLELHHEARADREFLGKAEIPFEGLL